jgi:hypothetical protein
MSELATNSKVWDKGAVQALIATNNKALAKALWNIYQRQTSDEQSRLETTHRNGRGFTGHDARFLSDIAKRLPTYSFNMTPRQVAKVRPMMCKYWRQLLEEIEAKGGQVDYRQGAKSPNSDIADDGEDDLAETPNSEIAAAPQGDIAEAINSEITEAPISGPAISPPTDQPALWGAF